MTPSEKLIKWSFHLSVNTIECFYEMQVYEDKIAELRTYEPGTLGRAIADCLDSHGLRLVPGFASHDLKHVLLGYDMTPVDEIRMQAFILGNGNITIPSVAIFLYGAPLLPNHWRTFLSDFRLGLASQPISDWSLASHAHAYTDKLRLQTIGTRLRVQRPPAMHLLTTLLIVLGAFGMCYCFPHLFSSSLEDLVGAGLAFVAGSVLLGTGVISKAMLIKRRQEQSAEDRGYRDAGGLHEDPQAPNFGCPAMASA